jgi:hypothetical protein
MTRLLNTRTWLVLSLIWVAGVTYLCWSSWPHLPLDVSSVDPTTQDAFRAAVRDHVLRHTGLALVVPAMTYLLGRLWCRARGN